MTLTEADEAELVRRLRHDVEATLGPGYEADIQYQAATKRERGVDPALYWEMVVEQVQEIFHDGFIHTTWPPCPRHRQHPLWLHGEYWMCEQDDVAVARLGELPSLGKTG